MADDRRRKRKERWGAPFSEMTSELVALISVNLVDAVAIHSKVQNHLHRGSCDFSSLLGVHWEGHSKHFNAEVFGRLVFFSTFFFIIIFSPWEGFFVFIFIGRFLLSQVGFTPFF